MRADEILRLTVVEALAVHPRCVREFVDRHMACVGCALARFETVAQVAAAYGQTPLDLAAALERASLSG